MGGQWYGAGEEESQSTEEEEGETCAGGVGLWSISQRV